VSLTNQPVRQRHPRENERKYLDTFRDTACESCGANDGTTVPAHCNLGGDGVGWKQTGVVAGLCASCHSAADGAPIVERYKVWIRVLTRLLKARYEEWKG